MYEIPYKVTIMHIITHTLQAIVNKGVTLYHFDTLFHPTDLAILWDIYPRIMAYLGHRVSDIARILGDMG